MKTKFLITIETKNVPKIKDEETGKEIKMFKEILHKEVTNRIEFYFKEIMHEDIIDNLDECYLDEFDSLDEYGVNLEIKEVLE